MHDKLVGQICIDCVAYSQHNADAGILDPYTKEQLAFAVCDLANKLNIVKRAARKQLQEKVK
jgi:hypothetical protein